MLRIVAVARVGVAGCLQAWTLAGWQQRWLGAGLDGEWYVCRGGVLARYNRVCCVYPRDVATRGIQSNDLNYLLINEILSLPRRLSADLPQTADVLSFRNGHVTSTTLPLSPPSTHPRPVPVRTVKHASMLRCALVKSLFLGSSHTIR